MNPIVDSTHKTYSSPIQEIHFSDYIDVLKRRKWIVISLFILIVGIVLAMSLMATPLYEARAQILLGGQPTPMNPLGEIPQRVPEINLYHETQVNLLKSKTLARNVLNELNLQKRLADTAQPHPLLALAGEILHLNRGKDTDNFNTKPVSFQDAQKLASSRALELYLKKLGIEPVRDSSLINVSFIGPDPELITQIVNAHARAAIESAIQQHQSMATEALNWLKAQISEQKKDVENSQRAIYEFKKQHNVLSLEDSQTIYSQELQELNSALTRAKSDRIAKEATYLQLQKISKNRGDAMQLPAIAADPVIIQLKNQMVELISRKLELATKYGPKHPKMIELKNGIEQLQKDMANEKKRLIASIETDLHRAIAVEKSINQSLNKQKAFAMSLGERAIEYEVLKQQAESSQDIYNFLLKQSEELGLSSAISSGNMHIIDKADVPIDPVSPKVLRNLLLAILISLFAGTGLAFFLEYLDNTVKTPMDVTVKLNLPVLGMIPFSKYLQRKKANDPLLEDHTDPSGKRELPPTVYHISNRLPNELRAPANGIFGKALIIGSVTSSEGKSTVISRIASNLTDAGLRVLLVDCDFQRPSLDKMFHISNGGGLGKSIERIMSYHVNSGSLADYSIDDLFFMISLRKLSGHLIVTNENQTLIAHFQNGVLLHIQNQGSPENSRIGSMLLNGGFITKEQLNDALQRHRRTGQPLGYLLVNSGYIGREKLRGPLRLQIEEYLQMLFSWKKGNFVFKPGMIAIYENEKIFFEEDYTPMINNLGRIESSKFIEKELFAHIKGLKKENLYLLPAGTSYKLIGALNQILMRKIFEKLRKHFDVVLIDTPPLDAVSGIESIFQLADGIVLVIKAGHLSIKILNGALNHLPHDKIIGAVLNQAKIDPQPYYY